MRKALALSIVLLSSLLVSTTAVAQPDPVTHGNVRLRIQHGTSTNWAGYAVETNLTRPAANVVSDVKGQWTVPVVTCSLTNTYSSGWVGMDGYADNTVEQTGTEQDCRNGQATYYAWYEMYPKYPRVLPITLHAGDTVSAEVRYAGSSTFLLTLKDVTTNTGFSTLQRERAGRESAEWIAEAPYSGGVLPLANFSTLNFTNVTATLGTATGGVNNTAWQYDPLTMAYPDGTVKAAPTTLTNGGQSFGVTWQHS